MKITLNVLLNMQQSILNHPQTTVKEGIIVTYHAVSAMTALIIRQRASRSLQKHFNEVYDWGPIMSLRDDMKDL